MESYRTLNLKALSMLSWAHKTYPNLQWLVRHDDDVYLRAPALLAQLSSRPPIRYFWGMFDHGSSPVRDPLHQHYNSYEQFPKQEHPAWGDIFPPYVFWLARRLKVWPTDQTLIPCLGLCKACAKPVESLDFSSFFTFVLHKARGLLWAMSADLVAATVKEFLADREAGPALSECTNSMTPYLFLFVSIHRSFAMFQSCFWPARTSLTFPWMRCSLSCMETLFVR